MPAGQDYNESAYLQRYPDLATGWMYWSADNVWKYGKPSNRTLKKLSDNLFWHWTNFGLKEGRVCGSDLPGTIYSAVFNAGAYVARYPDVTGVDEVTGKPNAYATNPQLHYNNIGMAQGRKPGYELLTANSPVGMTTPGTTTTVVDSTTIDAANKLNGDNAIAVNTLNPPAITTPVTTTTNNSVSTVISANPYILPALAVLAILIFSHKKKGAKYHSSKKLAL